MRWFAGIIRDLSCLVCNKEISKKTILTAMLQLPLRHCLIWSVAFRLGMRNNRLIIAGFESYDHALKNVSNQDINS